MPRRKYPTAARRLLRGTGYLMLAVAGGGGFFVYSEALNATIGVMTFAWAAFLLLGGGLGVYSAVSDRWIGELAGIPLLCSALMVYGFALLIIVPSTAGIIIAALMLSLAFLLLARWRDVLAFARASPYESHRQTG